MPENRCYAYSLGDCSPEMSREHYISYGVLKLIGNSLEISGFPWLQGEIKKLPPIALASRILCKHHNNVLSKLDSIAISFFSTFQHFNKGLGETKFIKNEEKTFSGHLVERWLVKLYLGLHYGGHFNSELHLEQIERYLLENLFFSKRLPNDFGLYFGGKLGSQIESFNGLRIKTFNSQSKNILAVAFEILGFPFYLSIRPGTIDGTGKIDPPCEYHPSGIDLKNHTHSMTKKIIFSWE
jgi:hypothetical protein